MPEQLIKNRQLDIDRWHRIESLVADENSPLSLPSGPVLLSASDWIAHREKLLARSDEVAVSLAPTFAVATLAADLSRFPMIAVEFPKFSDGRGYSTARLLRERYGYRGELRAVGDIGRDQLFFLHRVGFDAFLIPEGRDAAAALSAFADFPDVYQGAADQPLPLFRRRAA